MEASLCRFAMNSASSPFPFLEIWVGVKGQLSHHMVGSPDN